MGESISLMLDDIDDTDRARVLERCIRMRYAAGAYIFHGGEAGDCGHLLVTGMVAVLAGGWRGEPIMLSVMGPGEIFGEQAWVHPNHRRTATLQALTAVETLVLRRDDFEELSKRYPSINRFLMGMLSARVDRLTHQLVDASQLSATVRIYRGLLDLAHSFNVVDSGDPIPVTQQQVASAAGVRLRITNDVLADARHDGIVETARRRIVVLDWSEVRRRAHLDAV